MNMWSMEDTQGNENTLHDAIMIDICHYTFVQTHGIYTKIKLCTLSVDDVSM